MGSVNNAAYMFRKLPLCEKNQFTGGEQVVGGGKRKMMGRFFPDVQELVSSVFHVLDERVWRTVMWAVHSQQLAAIAGEVLWGF